MEGICGVVGEEGFEEDVPDHIFALSSCEIWIICLEGGGLAEFRLESWKRCLEAGNVGSPVLPSC